MKKNHLQHKINTKLFNFIILVLFTTFLNAQSQKCAVGFDIANNRDFKYAGKSGVHFIFIVTNKSNKIDTYSVLVNNSDADSDKNTFNRPNIKFKGRKVNLPINLDLNPTKRSNSNFVNNRSSKSSTNKSLEFKLKPNEQTLIVLKVDVPEGTEIGGVNTTNVTLKSTNCKNIAITKQVITETVDGE